MDEIGDIMDISLFYFLLACDCATLNPRHGSAQMDTPDVIGRSNTGASRLLYLDRFLFTVLFRFVLFRGFIFPPYNLPVFLSFPSLSSFVRSPAPRIICSSLLSAFLFFTLLSRCPPSYLNPSSFHSVSAEGFAAVP